MTESENNKLTNNSNSSKWIYIAFAILITNLKSIFSISTIYHAHQNNSMHSMRLTMLLHISSRNISLSLRYSYLRKVHNNGSQSKCSLLWTRINTRLKWWKKIEKIIHGRSIWSVSSSSVVVSLMRHHLLLLLLFVWVFSHMNFVSLSVAVLLFGMIYWTFTTKNFTNWKTQPHDMI